MNYIEVDVAASAGGFIKSIIFVEKIEAIQEPIENKDDGFGAIILTDKNHFVVRQKFGDLKNMFAKLP